MHDVQAFTSGPGPVAVESHVGPGQAGRAGLTLRNTSAGAAFAACTAAVRDLQRFKDLQKSQVKVKCSKSIEHETDFSEMILHLLVWRTLHVLPWVGGWLHLLSRLSGGSLLKAIHGMLRWRLRIIIIRSCPVAHWFQDIAAKRVVNG